MGDVFANGREVSAKADATTSMGAMPDVCLSPPSPPAGPIPIPYPNFADCADTTDGTKTVQIVRKEVGMKNSSKYKQSKGDEAATKSLGMNVISHNIQGPMKFAAWSMDVKFEGENAIRQLDLTTHNHINQSGGAMRPSGGGNKRVQKKTTCQELADANKAAQAEKRPKKRNVGRGRTVAVGRFKSRKGKVIQVKTSSHMSQKKKLPDGWVEGNKQKDGDFKPTKMCEEAKKALGDQYSKTGRGKSQSPMCHAESRIVETIFTELEAAAASGGTLTLRIQWHPGKYKNPQMSTEPCPQCHKMLCAVQNHCKITIKICRDPAKPPEKLDCSEFPP